VGETISGPQGTGEDGVIEPTKRSACIRSRGPVGSEGRRREH
jgi:hypothetical protein